MNAQQRLAPFAVLATALALVAGPRASADAPRSGDEAAQLQRNIHDIRRIVDGERAQLDGALRTSAGPLVVDSRDAPGIGTLREQLSRSLERLENRCFGIDVTVNDGNAILICGNNNGEAESANVTNSASTTVVVAPPPPARAAPPSSGGPAESERPLEAAPQANEVQP